MYEHDIFLSYARRNNSAGWVTQFRNALENVLREKLDDVSIFMDVKDIEGGRTFDGRILRSIKQSAVLVIVVSDASLDTNREWFHRERDEFIGNAGGVRASDGRVYLVNYDGIDQHCLPEPIRLFTPYRFFDHDPETNVIRPARLIAERAGCYHDELYSLRRDLIKAFHSLGAPCVVRNRDSSRITDPDRPSARGELSPVTDPERRTVFLAEPVPGELENMKYRQVESAVAQQARVVPGRKSFYAAGGDIEKEVEDYLGEADLFVQLIFPQPWPLLPERFEDGYERWLFDQAVRHNVPVLRWHSRDLPVEFIKQHHQHHYEFLQLDDPRLGGPRVCDLSEFIPLVLEELERQTRRDKFDVHDDAFPVLVLADDVDKGMGDEVGSQLESVTPSLNGGSIESELVIWEGDSPIDIGREADALLPRGLVVAWDQGPQPRFHDLMRQCRRYRRARELNPPPCAVVVPSLATHPVRRRPPGFEVIAQDDTNGLGDFVNGMFGEVA